MAKHRRPRLSPPGGPSPIIHPDMGRPGVAPVINLFGIAGPGGEGTITTLDQLLHGLANHLGATILVASMLAASDDRPPADLATDARDIMEAILEELQRDPKKDETPPAVEKGPQDAQDAQDAQDVKKTP